MRLITRIGEGQLLPKGISYCYKKMPITDTTNTATRRQFRQLLLYIGRSFQCSVGWVGK